MINVVKATYKFCGLDYIRLIFVTINTAIFVKNDFICCLLKKILYILNLSCVKHSRAVVTLNIFIAILCNKSSNAFQLF